MNRNELSRREFLQFAGAAAGLTLLPRVAAANVRVIRAEPALATLVGAAYPPRTRAEIAFVADMTPDAIAHDLRALLREARG